MLVAVSFLLLDLLWFFSTDITFAKRVLYIEDNQVIQVGWRNPKIAQVILGPGNEGQWILNEKQDSDCLTMLVPLFEDLRDPILSITTLMMKLEKILAALTWLHRVQHKVCPVQLGRVIFPRQDQVP